MAYYYVSITCRLLLCLFYSPLAVVADATNYMNDTDRLVFAHFIMGTSRVGRASSDYDQDMKRARAFGIDAFALNIGVDPFTDQQLGLLYESASNNDMKVFISIDFNWWRIDQTGLIGEKIARFSNQPAQLLVDDKVFVSSFGGDGLDVMALRAAVGRPIFFAPNLHPPFSTELESIDGLLNWMAWPSDGNNKAPAPGRRVSVADGDTIYLNALAGKSYIAPVSPWFFTHFGPEVSYSKNWVFPSDLLWFHRWMELLALSPRFIEILTWNDYGESHYIGPLNSPHTDDGASKWTNTMPHDGWLDVAKPFIDAFKQGASSPDEFVTSDKLVYWYRPNPREIYCGVTDTCMSEADNSSGNYFIGRPDGWQQLNDSVFVVSLLTSAATVRVSSGGNVYSYEAPLGVSAKEVSMGLGPQSFAVIRGGQTILSGTGTTEITDECVYGAYNYNAYGKLCPTSYGRYLIC
ncbi:CAZyme family GH71 [Penicillium canescens]|nr:CAZyme family GH71 [Penicillium canescens]KAJ6050645.1 CAZyme family GH71 [Penicillium canescens]